MALSNFTLQQWIFVNTNFLGLLKYIPDDEKEDFDFNFENVNTSNIFKNCLIGAQKYLFNTDYKKINQSSQKLKKLVLNMQIYKTINKNYFQCLYFSD